MARKKIAQEPTVSAEGTAAAPAKAAGAGSSGSANKARAPRASANAVTHRHKIAATTENPTLSPATPEEVAQGPLVPEIAQTPDTPTLASRAVNPPTHDEIAIRAFLLAESRGFQNGTPEDDWLAAERQLRFERTGS
jgi:hypothetical protein